MTRYKLKRRGAAADRSESGSSVAGRPHLDTDATAGPTRSPTRPVGDAFAPWCKCWRTLPTTLERYRLTLSCRRHRTRRHTCRRRPANARARAGRRPVILEVRRALELVLGPGHLQPDAGRIIAAAAHSSVAAGAGRRPGV